MMNFKITNKNGKTTARRVPNLTDSAISHFEIRH